MSARVIVRGLVAVGFWLGVGSGIAFGLGGGLAVAKVALGIILFVVMGGGLLFLFFCTFSFIENGSVRWWVA